MICSWWHVTVTMTRHHAMTCHHDTHLQLSPPLCRCLQSVAVVSELLCKHNTQGHVNTRVLWRYIRNILLLFKDNATSHLHLYLTNVCTTRWEHFYKMGTLLQEEIHFYKMGTLLQDGYTSTRWEHFYKIITYNVLGKTSGWCFENCF